MPWSKIVIENDFVRQGRDAAQADGKINQGITIIIFQQWEEA